MTVRLGFAIAAHLDPEILVVDEVLAVGDAEFQKKAIGKMQDVSKGEGRTVLFVSHNMAAIETLCTRGIVLKDGRLDYAGDIPSSINHYLANKTTNVEGQSILKGISKCNSNMIINEILINGKDNNVVYIDENHSDLHFEFRGELKDEKKIALEVRLYDFRGVIQALYSPSHLNGNTKIFEAGPFYYSETVRLPKNLTKGEFSIDIHLTQPNIEGFFDILNHVKIFSKGIVSETGFEFDYQKYGLLILD
jgi:lipopolysaccharide transport system ATP-binding protein